LPRLLTRAKDQIDDDVRRQSAELIFVIGKPIPVSLDLYNPRFGKTNIAAAVKDPDLMPGTEQFTHQW
jgi:fructose-specific component phosphotransferase system IIB-like protein